jgi:hypothetical protein
VPCVGVWMIDSMLSSGRRGRVTQGGCPPRVPADPDLWEPQGAIPGATRPQDGSMRDRSLQVFQIEVSNRDVGYHVSTMR